LNVQAGSPFKIRVIDYSYELPQTSLQPRPPNMIVQPFGLSDTTVVVKTYFFDKAHQREGVSGIISETDYEARFTKILK
jgi:hypothetical protein